MLRSQATRTESFFGAMHVSHQLALLQGHANVFFCKQCGAVNAGGILRLLKSQCDGTGESRQQARRKLEQGLLPNAQVAADANCAFELLHKISPDVAGCFDSPCIFNLTGHQKRASPEKFTKPACFHGIDCETLKKFGRMCLT